MIAGLSSTVSAMDTIIADRNYYLEMIEYAEENPEYQKEAKITNVVYNLSCKKYYIKYIIPYTEVINGSVFNHSLWGYTYSIYSKEDITNFSRGDKIMVACNSSVVTGYTDSITMDYKDYPLSADGEYLNEQKSKKTFTVLICVFSGIMVGGVVLMIIFIKKNTYAFETPQTAKNLELYEKNKYRKCSYCGSSLTAGKIKCHNCGASVPLDNMDTSTQDSTNIASDKTNIHGKK